MTGVQHKILRDLGRERGRTFIVVVAVAVGIAGFTAVLSAYSILTRELNKGFLSTNPPSATFHVDRIDDETIGAIVATGSVAQAEARRVLRGRIKTGPEWRGLSLLVIKDFTRIKVGILQPDKGAWPPQAGEMLIERNAFQVAQAKIGDTAAVEIAGGREQRLRIAGGVHDVGVAQARMENIVYGYITTETLGQLGQEPFLNELNILVSGDRWDENHIRTVAAEVRSLLETRGHPVRRLDIPPAGKHPHADIMDLLLVFMSAFGFAILLLSGVLTINLLVALMAEQVRQIGVMKAIGAANWQIAALYFAEVLMMGVAAVLIALPVGIAGGMMLCRYLAVLLNFDMSSFALPAWVYLLVLASGIGVPLAAASLPIIKGTGIPVRQAIADFGTSGDSYGANRLDKMLTAAGGPFRPVLMVVRNTLRRRRRFALTVTALAMSGAVFISAFNIRASLIRTLDRSFATKEYDLWVTFDSLYPIAELQMATRGIGAITKSEGWIVTEASLSTGGDDLTPASPEGHTPSEGRSDGLFTVIGLPQWTTLLRMEMLAGRTLRPEDKNAIVVNSALVARHPALKVGETISLRTGTATLQWQIVGIAREPFFASTAYVSQASLEYLGGHQGMANSLRIALSKPKSAVIKEARDLLEQNLQHAGLRTVGSTTKAESRYGFDQHMVMIYVFLLITSALISVVGGLGLMTSTTLNIMERRREIGILRAIGATPRMVSLTVVAESIVTSLVSCSVAALLAWPISETLGNTLVSAMFRTSLVFEFEPLGFGLWLAVSTCIAVVASVVPATRASQVTVREALM